MTNGEEQDKEQSRSRRGVKNKSGYGEEHIEKGKYRYSLVLLDTMDRTREEVGRGSSSMKAAASDENQRSRGRRKKGRRTDLGKVGPLVLPPPTSIGWIFKLP